MEGLFFLADFFSLFIELHKLRIAVLVSKI